MKKVGSTLVVTMGFLGWSGVCVAQSESDLCKKPCTVTVSVTKRGDGYKVTLSPSDKLRLSAKAAHRVVWNFKNESGKEMDLGISKFTPAPPDGKPDPDTDADPLDGAPRHKKVAHGKSDSVQATVKKDAKPWRTYRYDILDGTTVLEDPEIEIRP